ncbi:MAG: hypothetical protein M1381_01085 [Deltaproteobacteria bacterium]|nr:hypothetical protein [Deltaproteobacteria bacterium]MCL5792162.1 hypothetical protein [Deltaproteobacteria bacterium]
MDDIVDYIVKTCIDRYKQIAWDNEEEFEELFSDDIENIKKKLTENLKGYDLKSLTRIRDDIANNNMELVDELTNNAINQLSFVEDE